MSKLQIHEKGFTTAVILIGVGVVVAGAGFYAWQQNTNSSQPSTGGESSQTTETNNSATDNKQAISDKKGTFQGVGQKTGSGSVSLISKDDGSYAVRLENDFKVQRGPALYVSFANNGEVAHDTIFAELKAFEGNQEYAVPSSIDPSKYSQIMIYCKEFSVPFSVATIE